VAPGARWPSAGRATGTRTVTTAPVGGSPRLRTETSPYGGRRPRDRRQIEQQGGRALAATCNVTRSNDIAAALDQTMETFGRLDVAFNNAGAEQPVTPTADIADDVWNRVININLTGVFLCMQQQIPLMLSGSGGAIVNTASRRSRCR